MKTIIILLSVLAYSITTHAQSVPVGKDTTIKPHKEWYYNFTYLSYGVGVAKNENTISSFFNNGTSNVHYEQISTVNDYRFNHLIAAGINVGFMRYPYGYSTYYFIPLLADVRFFLPISKINLFIAIDGGYGVSLSSVYNYPSLFIFEPSIGISIPVKDKVSIGITLSYELQEYSYKTSIQTLTFQTDTTGNGFGNNVGTNSTLYGTATETINAINLGIGITFK